MGEWAGGEMKVREVVMAKGERDDKDEMAGWHH